MNTRRTLAKNRHDDGVSLVNPRHLHVEGQLEGRNALQDQLAVIGELPFVPFQGQRQQAEPDGHRQHYKQDQTRVPDIAQLHSEKSGDV